MSWFRKQSNGLADRLPRHVFAHLRARPQWVSPDCSSPALHHQLSPLLQDPPSVANQRATTIGLSFIIHPRRGPNLFFRCLAQSLSILRSPDCLASEGGTFAYDTFSLDDFPQTLNSLQPRLALSNCCTSSSKDPLTDLALNYTFSLCPSHGGHRTTPSPLIGGDRLGRPPTRGSGGKFKRYVLRVPTAPLVNQAASGRRAMIHRVVSLPSIDSRMLISPLDYFPAYKSPSSSYFSNGRSPTSRPPPRTPEPRQWLVDGVEWLRE